MSQLIASRKIRDQQNAEKMAKVIRFLKQETYSDKTNLMLLLAYKDRAPLDRLLNKMIAFDYLRKEVFDFPTGKYSIWGITSLGLAQFIDNDDEDYRAFEPSRMKFSTATHKLLNQKAYIYLQRNGWTNWQNADQFSFRRKYETDNRPDAIINTQSNVTVAIETERTLKTADRYRAIFKSHILAKQKGYWEMVFYVVEDKKMQQALERRFDSVKYIPFDKSNHPFSEYRKNLVRVFTLDELKLLKTK